MSQSCLRSVARDDRVPRNAVGMAVAPRRCGALLYISVAFIIPEPILAAQSAPAPCSAPGHVWTAPLRQVLSWRDDDCGQSCVWPVDAAILHDCWPCCGSRGGS